MGRIASTAPYSQQRGGSDYGGTEANRVAVKRVGPNGKTLRRGFFTKKKPCRDGRRMVLFDHMNGALKLSARLTLAPSVHENLWNDKSNSALPAAGRASTSRFTVPCVPFHLPKIPT